MNKIRCDFFFFSLCVFFSFTSFGWDTKDEFDKDFKESVAKFLKTRGQTHILYKNIKDFVEGHAAFLKEYNKFCTYDSSDSNRPWFGVMKEIDSFSETELDAFESFFCVGPRKSLANLPTHTHIKNEEIKSAIESWAASIGYKTYISAAPGERGGLWVFDPDALSKLLIANSALLSEHNVSQDPLEFIKEIDKQDEKGNEPFDLKSGKARMFQLIARAFGREMSLEDIEKLMKEI